MNELASEIADRLAEQAAALPRPAHHAGERRAGDRRRCGRGGRARCRSGPGRDLHGRAGQRRLHPAHDRRATPDPASPCGPTIRRSPAWRRSTPAGPSRWTSSSRWGRARSGPTPGWSTSCSRSSATRRRPSAACWCWRPHAPHRRGRRLGGAEGAAHAGAAHLCRRPHREPRGRRPDLGPDPRDRSAQDGDAGFRRPAGGERHRHARRSRRSPRTISGPSAAPTTASCTAARPAIPSAPATTSWRSWPRRCRRRPPATTAPRSTTSSSATRGDFYKIDPLLFSPAEVWLTSAESGRTFHAGGLNPDVLDASRLPELRTVHPLTQEHSMRRSPSWWLIPPSRSRGLRQAGRQGTATPADTAPAADAAAPAAAPRRS